jgi:hypothetical protein
MTKQARILAFTDNEGRALYLKLDGAVIAMRDIAQDILRNFNAYPQEIPLFADHKWGQAYGWVKSIAWLLRRKSMHQASPRPLRGC